LLGARLVGRWKSGAPIVLSPLEDDPNLGSDPTRNNNFGFDRRSQERFPFAAHIRKTYPRNDIDDPERFRSAEESNLALKSLSKKLWKRGPSMVAVSYSTATRATFLTGSDYIKSNGLMLLTSLIEFRRLALIPLSARLLIDPCQGRTLKTKTRCLASPTSLFSEVESISFHLLSRL